MHLENGKIKEKFRISRHKLTGKQEHDNFKTSSRKVVSKLSYCQTVNGDILAVIGGVVYVMI